MCLALFVRLLSELVPGLDVFRVHVGRAIREECHNDRCKNLELVGSVFVLGPNVGFFNDDLIGERKPMVVGNEIVFDKGNVAIEGKTHQAYSSGPVKHFKIKHTGVCIKNTQPKVASSGINC